MSANDSEHLARESRSPPGTPCQKTHPMKIGWVFYCDTSTDLAVGLVEFCVAGLLALLGREPGQVRKEAAPATDTSAGG